MEYLLDKTKLSQEEKNLLVGQVCAEYERLRYNGSAKQVMYIYDHDTIDNYVEEKTGNFFACGRGFAAYLDNFYLKRLGSILISNSKGE